MKPTQYYLTFKANNCGEYDVYQQHNCPDKSKLWTEEEYITTCIPGKEAEFVEEFDKEIQNGHVAGYEVEEYIKVER